MNLLPKARLVRTSRIDHADWNYRPFIAYAMRRRFALALSLLPRDRVHRLLEIGFGSGILMPELMQHCEDLYGIDVHDQIDAVRKQLLRSAVQATLERQDAAHTGFPDGFFDRIVLISALEFIEHVEEAAGEFARILTQRGRLIAVMPGKSAFLDFLLRAVTGEDAMRDYGDRREKALPAMLKYFRVTRTKRFFPLYAAYEFEVLA